MILCLDYGSRYLGVAITDPDERLALRHSVIDQKQVAALPVLQTIIDKERVTTIVVGVPISLSGNESQQTKVSRNFIDMLKAAFPTLTFAEADETLTSYEAEQRIKAEGGKPGDAHAEAARLILETYLTRK
ncbi:MAG: Holliday junction resolvase RuvX [Candidatus Andersenbacteria bacterium]